MYIHIRGDCCFQSQTNYPPSAHHWFHHVPLMLGTQGLLSRKPPAAEPFNVFPRCMAMLQKDRKAACRSPENAVNCHCS